MKILQRIVLAVVIAPFALMIISIPVFLLIIFSGWQPPSNNGISDSIENQRK
jgi:hypothetical protein